MVNCTTLHVLHSTGWALTPIVQQAPGLILGIVGEDMLQEWFWPCCDSVWSDAVVSEQIKHLHLVPRQQAQLLSGVHLDHFSLNKCLQPEELAVQYVVCSYNVILCVWICYNIWLCFKINIWNSICYDMVWYGVIWVLCSIWPPLILLLQRAQGL